MVLAILIKIDRTEHHIMPLGKVIYIESNKLVELGISK